MTGQSQVLRCATTLRSRLREQVTASTLAARAIMRRRADAVGAVALAGILVGTVAGLISHNAGTRRWCRALGDFTVTAPQAGE